jgi:hypothetical protein
MICPAPLVLGPDDVFSVARHDLRHRGLFWQILRLSNFRNEIFLHEAEQRAQPNHDEALK